MSYSYVCPFVGIPLNQLDPGVVDVECANLLEELQAFCDDEIAIQNLEYLSPLAGYVREWFLAYHPQLEAMDVGFYLRTRKKTPSFRAEMNCAFEIEGLYGIYKSR